MDIGTHYRGDDRCEFRVWAPFAEQVNLKMVAPVERTVSMNAAAEGYWEITLPDVPPGTQYFYQLRRITEDGSFQEQCFPDPASQFQPNGVHGPSQVVDHRFEWSDRDWSGIPIEDLILYELHVGTFTPEGTFEAIIPRLEELRSLGVNAIEIMPIAQFPGDGSSDPQQSYRNWGYDGTYVFAVQNSYGGPLGLKRLVDACHQHSIAIVLDVVYNHFGPEGNYIGEFGPYFTQTYRTPWGNAINFDGAHSHPVRNFFLENAQYWTEAYHIDALRLDAVQAIYDLGAKHLLQELAERMDQWGQQQGRRYHLIAESDLNDARLIRPAERGGYGLDAQWSDDFHHALYTLLTGVNQGYYQDYGRCEQLAKAYRDTFVYDWQYAPHRFRFHGSPTRDRPYTQFVVCIQNHDQVANTLPGDRLAQRISFESLKLAAGAVLLSPYIPLLFMGEEYGEKVPFTYFVSHSDPELIQAVRRGRKQEFEAFHVEQEPPDPEAIDTFLQCKLRWEQRHEGNHGILWSFYQHLIQLRRTLPALVHRDRNCLEAWSDEEYKLVGWRRWTPTEQLLCLMNFNDQPSPHPLTRPDPTWHKILDSAESKWSGPGPTTPEHYTPSSPLTLPPHSFVLYRTSVQ